MLNVSDGSAPTQQTSGKRLSQIVLDEISVMPALRNAVLPAFRHGDALWMRVSRHRGLKKRVW